ncbi:hypothetical protein NDU88_002997 [Pleurodeles waltl]|uniref:60S ribosomal protein L35a n=1 Tax=Pleurodeles waltl TaxID=8319 RepID=A0AAV7P8K5_PLEWA|nr:hypothetical protein NDU88_002997 [Pleurodeles waltl]
MAVKTTGETYNTMDTYLYRRSVGYCTYVPDSVPARQRRALLGVLKYAYTNPEVQPGSGDVRVSGCPGHGHKNRKRSNARSPYWKGTEQVKIIVNGSKERKTRMKAHKYKFFFCGRALLTPENIPKAQDM